MQHIRTSRGRPIKAGREVWKSASSRLRFFRRCFEAYADVPADNDNLVWSVPFEELVDACQTVAGIARLAGQDRSTVYRNKVKVGGVEAMVYVLKVNRRRKNPIVRQHFPWSPLHPGAKLSMEAVLDFIAGAKVSKRSGAGYHPIGRVTAVEVCQHFGINRRAFYRWRKGLLSEHRAYLDNAMQPHVSVGGVYGATVTTSRKRGGIVTTV